MNLMDLFIKISVDDQASSQVEALSGKLKSGLTTAAKVGVAAVAAAGTAVAAIGKQSIEQYAEYEQLVGGVETLFKQSADVVQQYAANAYKTAGMSANEYMETVTSFSASLLQNLDGDTAAAAEKANLAITDMADNANKMGTSMEMIQNAYQGFAKQNYTMLDNLKLGYGGTQAEMQRLLDDAEKLSGQKFDLSSYSDIVDAIHVVQTEMGITGTTAKEAADTISGSVFAMKSAWQNLVTGIADDNADLDTLIGNFVQSAETAAGNIIPRITQILSGMGSAIEQIAPILAAEIPNLITSVLPSLVSGGAQLVVGLVTGIAGALPELVAAVPSIVSSIVDSISGNLPAISETGSELLEMLATGIVSGIPAMLEMLPQVFVNIYNWLDESLPGITEKGFDILISLVGGIIDAIPDMIEQLPAIITSITEFFVDNFPEIIKKGGELLGKLLVGIIGAIPEIAKQLPEIITAIVEALEAGWEQLKEAGKDLLEGLWNGIDDKVEWLKGKVSGVVDTIKSWFTGKEGFDTHSPSKWAGNIGGYIMQGLSIGMENSKGEVMDTVESIISEVKGRFESAVDFFSAGKNIADLQYELWERTDGENASEAEKLSVRLISLGRQQQQQAGIVEAAEAAYKAVAEQYGEVSEESYKYQERLLKEKLALQDLLDTIKEVSSARDEAYNSQAMQTGTVSFADSMIAKATLPVVNAVAQSSRPANNQGETSFNLVLPDGVKLASYLFRPLVQYAAANGTPILNPA